MALSATLYTARLQLADQDRELYQDFSLKLAQHPSEQPERLIARLLAWCLYADERLNFTRGLSSSHEPDIWLHNDAGEIEHWIEVGEPEASRIRKASHQARQVTLVAYTRSQAVWWKKQGHEILAQAGVQVLSIPWTVVQRLGSNLSRQINWQVTISERTLFISVGDEMIEVEVTPLVTAA